MKNRFLPCAIVVASLVGGAKATAGSYVGREFPDFTAKDAITGKQFSLRDLRGKVVLVDFWATWCGPCVAELPNVKRAYSSYKSRGFEIVSISLDQDRRRFESFVRNKRMTWYHVMEGGGWKTRLAGKYRINSIPRVFVLDADGVCIAENARGRQLDAAIRKGLATVGDSESVAKRSTPKQRQEPPPTRRRPPRRDPVELTAAREALAAIAAPVRDVDRRLRALEAEMDALQRELPVPEDPIRAKRRAAYIHKELVDARHAMFMLGLLDAETAPALPPRPEARPDDPRRWSSVRDMLDAARTSLERMREALTRVSDELAALEAEIREAEEAMTRGTAGASRSEEVAAELNGAADRFRAAMVGQLDVANRIIADCCQPLDKMGATLDTLDERLVTVRDAVEAAPRETKTLRELRDAFAELCDDLEKASELVHAGGSQTITLPTNPFDRRRLKDRRVLAELDAQLDVVERASAALRAVVAERRGRFDPLIAEVAALQDEVAARLEAGRTLDDLRPRFSDLSRKVLALHDPAAET